MVHLFAKLASGSCLLMVFAMKYDVTVTRSYYDSIFVSNNPVTAPKSITAAELLSDSSTTNEGDKTEEDEKEKPNNEEVPKQQQRVEEKKKPEVGGGDGGAEPDIQKRDDNNKEKEDWEVVAERSGEGVGTRDLRPRNLNLAFLGDSVTRYQYIDFVYYLKYQKWIPDPAADEPNQPNLLFKHTYRDWRRYLVESHLALVPEEKCDCYIPPGKFYMFKYAEQRYFSDNRSNTVTFVNKYGHRESHGHWDAAKVYGNNSDNKNDNTTEGELLPRPQSFDYGTSGHNFTWVGNWSYTIREHIAKLNPKPDYLVFNAGLHPHDLKDPVVQEEIKSALQDNNITGIYKTTTFPRGEVGTKKRFRRGYHDAQMCGKVFENCLDYRWTKNYAGDEHYFDENHMKPHLNTRMNLELLDYLKRNSNNKMGGATKLKFDDEKEILPSLASSAATTR